MTGDLTDEQHETMLRNLWASQRAARTHERFDWFAVSVAALLATSLAAGSLSMIIKFFL